MRICRSIYRAGLALALFCVRDDLRPQRAYHTVPTATLPCNLLPVSTAPTHLYVLELSDRRMRELGETGDSFLANCFSYDGSHFSFTDPRSPGSPVRTALISTSITSIAYPDYILNSKYRSVAIGLWNSFLSDWLASKGLLMKGKHRYYFPPENGAARELTWQPQSRSSATRQVAYPYIGKKTGKVAFWVHHACRNACRISFKEVGGELFLQLIPAYVFTRDGVRFVHGSDAGALSTSRMSRERNYQVLNRLFFWSWYLRWNTDQIQIPCGREWVFVSPCLVHAIAQFGIGTDRKTISAILKADYDVNWSELEAQSARDASLED